MKRDKDERCARPYHEQLLLNLTRDWVTFALVQQHV
jgi:hypothetical protein